MSACGVPSDSFDGHNLKPLSSDTDPGGASSVCIFGNYSLVVQFLYARCICRYPTDSKCAGVCRNAAPYIPDVTTYHGWNTCTIILSPAMVAIIFSATTYIVDAVGVEVHHVSA